MCSIESSFQFLSFKVDKLSLIIEPNLKVLLIEQPTSDKIQLGVSIRNTMYDSNQRIYVGGVDLMAMLFWSSEQKPDQKFLECNVGVAGVFKVVGDDLTKEIEEKLVKIQIPAILFPYARSAMTSAFSSSGFGSIVLPLINVHQLAKSQENNLQIIPFGSETAPAK
jgi:preprotein translocase subunit SecB